MKVRKNIFIQLLFMVAFLAFFGHETTGLFAPVDVTIELADFHSGTRGSETHS